MDNKIYNKYATYLNTSILLSNEKYLKSEVHKNIFNNIPLHNFF